MPSASHPEGAPTKGPPPPIDPPPPGAVPSLALWKRALFVGLLVFLVAAFVEGVAWVALQRLRVDGLRADVSEFLADRTAGGQAGAPHRPKTKLSADDLAALDPRRPRVNGQGPGRIEVVHPYIGFALTSDQTPVGQPLTDLGFLQQALFKRTDQQLIVAVTGGSVARQISWYGLPELEAELRKYPPFAERDFRFVGLNMGGFKQPQQLMTLNYLLSLGGEFDLVLNLDGFNEVALHEAENGRKGVFPAFPRWWNRRVNDVSNPTMRRAAGELALLQRSLKRVAARAGGFSSLNVARVVQAFQVRRLHEQINAVVGEMLSSDSGRAMHYVATGPQRSFSDQELYEHLVGIWSRSSLQMHFLAQGGGFEYFHFLQPNQYVAGGKPMGAEERRRAYDPRMRYRPGAVKGYPGLIREGARLTEHGVHFYDLTKLFAGEKSPAYADTCCHFTEDAAGIIAAEMGRRVVERLEAKRRAQGLGGFGTRSGDQPR